MQIAIYMKDKGTRSSFGVLVHCCIMQLTVALGNFSRFDISFSFPLMDFYSILLQI